MISLDRRSTQRLTSRFPLVLRAVIPRRRADRESLCRRDDSVEGIQLRPIDHSRLVTHQHPLGIIEGVDDDCASVAELDLEYGVAVLSPPFLTSRCVVVA